MKSDLNARNTISFLFKQQEELRIFFGNILSKTNQSLIDQEF